MPTYDNDNIFAKILRGEIPSYKIYEDDDTFAFLDVMPVSKGHTLVIPKTPSRNLLDADPETLAQTIKIVHKIANAAKSAFAPDGIALKQFNEQPAGQSVFHLHFHIIPVYEGVPQKAHAQDMEDAEILTANAKALIAAL